MPKILAPLTQTIGHSKPIFHPLILWLQINPLHQFSLTLKSFFFTLISQRMPFKLSVEKVLGLKADFIARYIQ